MPPGPGTFLPQPAVLWLPSPSFLPCGAPAARQGLSGWLSTGWLRAPWKFFQSPHGLAGPCYSPWGQACFWNPSLSCPRSLRRWLFQGGDLPHCRLSSHLLSVLRLCSMDVECISMPAKRVGDVRPGPCFWWGSTCAMHGRTVVVVPQGSPSPGQRHNRAVLSEEVLPLPAGMLSVASQERVSPGC